MTSRMFDEARSGIQHSTGTNTNIKAFKYFTLTPSVSYEDTWYFDYLKKEYDATYDNGDDTYGAVVTDTLAGFKRFNEYNVSASLSTNIYGTFNFKKGRLKAIRHTMRPSVSWGYRPDFSEKHEVNVLDDAGEVVDTYTPFDNGIYGSPSGGISNAIGISVSNVLEAKVTPRDEEELDGDEDYKKVTLLNSLNFSTSYNMAADSLRWSNVSVSASTRLFKDKLNLNLSGSLDPYQVTSEGVRIDEFNSNIFRISSASLTANYSISSKDLAGGKDNNKKETNGNKPPDVYGADINQGNTNRQQPPGGKQQGEEEATTELYRAKVPWNISFAYSSSYTNNGYSVAGIQNHTVGFNGNVELTPKWKVGFSSGYDLLEGAFSYTRLNFARDLDSWNFTFNWVPFGTNTSYTFFIGVKSSMLSDLKWDKVKPADRIF